MDVIYEPPQGSTPTVAELLRTHDAAAEAQHAATVARALGLKWVGWAYSHPTRAHTFTMVEVARMCAMREAAIAEEPEVGPILASHCSLFAARLPLDLLCTGRRFLELDYQPPTSNLCCPQLSAADSSGLSRANRSPLPCFRAPIERAFEGSSFQRCLNERPEARAVWRRVGAWKSGRICST